MKHRRFDAREALALLGELSHLTAPPASQEEICHQALSLTARALASEGGAVLLCAEQGSIASIAARWGKGSAAELARLGNQALREKLPMLEIGAKNRAPEKVAISFGVNGTLCGALVLDRPGRWGTQARTFAQSVARAVANSLQAARLLGESRAQRELLALRNIELEALRALAGRLQGLSDENEMLQVTLDLVIDRLALSAGWILLGDAETGVLGLSASRGLDPTFTERAAGRGIGPCLCRDVFRSGSLMFARNTVDCPRLPEIVRGNAPMTHACIPLKFERGTLGVMNILNRPGQIFTREELGFMEAVGNQVCMAVDKHRTLRAETRRDTEARALATLARSMGGSLDQEKVLEAVGGYARELLSAERCMILLGDESGPLHFAYLVGPPLEGLVLGENTDFAAMGSKATLEALRTRETVVLENALDSSRANADIARRWGVGSAILIPLVSHQQVLGVLIATRPGPSAWSAQEIELGTALAGPAAVAIDNARLYREAREALVRLQNAQYGMMRAERLATVGTVASSLAHEVRNPLNSINLQLVLLSRRVGQLEQPVREQIERLVDTARREIDRLDGLVEEFLSLSSIDRVTLDPESPEEIVREVISLMAETISERRISLVEEIPPGLPTVRMDREKVKQVLINLVRNSIDAMPDGGRIVFGCRLEGGWVTLSVSDTGTGIEPGLDVFDFFTTTKTRGSGLGLPISRRIIEAHGGSLTYTSAPGEGTVFSITLKAD